MDTDAPQISTLREESTPPPAPPSRAAGTRPRVKLVVHSINGLGTAVPQVSLNSPSRTNGHRLPQNEADPEVEEEEEEDEEDQLIDDDDADVESVSTSAPAPALPPPAAVPPIVIPGGRGTKRGRGGSARGGGRGKRGGRIVSSPVSRQTPENWDASSIGTGTPISTPMPPKKKTKKNPPASLRKTVATGKPVIVDDGDSVSEAFSGTAPSSPLFQENILLPDIDMGPPPLPTVMAPPHIDGESGPIPQYPLPVRPFVVQAMPKIATGFAPLVPLDKSTRKARHWRVANREIRGIAGGRWFTRSWVGEKDSEIASHSQVGVEKERQRQAAITSAAAMHAPPPFTSTPKPIPAPPLVTNGTPSVNGSGNGAGTSGFAALALPKLATMSMGIGTGKSSKTKLVKTELSSASSTRSGSIVAMDGPPTREPSKMRHSIAAAETVEIMDVDEEPHVPVAVA